MISDAKKKKNNNIPKRCFTDGILAENDVIDLKKKFSCVKVQNREKKLRK